MEIGSFAQIGSLAIAAIALVISVLGASRKGWEERVKAARDATEEAHKRITEIDARIVRLERDVQHLPDKDLAHRMEMSIARLEGRLETMDERLKPVAAMAARMQEHLLERG